MLADTAHLVLALLMAGVAVIFLWTDRNNSGTRSLAGCLFAAAAASTLGPAQVLSAQTITLAALQQLAETAALLFGIEWGIRISRDSQDGRRLVRFAGWLLRAGQIVLLVYGGLSIGYVVLFPEYAVIDPEGLVKVRAIEFAVFSPLLGTAMGLSAGALILLTLSRLDPIERIRFRALLVAGPLFLLTLLVNEEVEPLLTAMGLLVILGGSVRYLIIQTQRGESMRQFLSPEVASMVKLQGMDGALSRERREISVLACDLRGFTAYARSTDSDQVIQLLERYYAEVGELAQQAGGTVKDHAGDGILILFGAPSPSEQFAAQAVALARSIGPRLRPWLQQGDLSLGLGIGIATGEATIGAIRGAGRLEYVAVGNVVNLASRLCDQAADGEVLIDATSCREAALGDAVSNRGTVAMKGYAEPVPVFALSSPADAAA